MLIIAIVLQNVCDIIIQNGLDLVRGIQAILGSKTFALKKQNRKQQHHVIRFNISLDTESTLIDFHESN